MGRSLKASKDGIEKVRRAFLLKGYTQDYLAGASACSRQTLARFLARKAIDKSIFQAICTELDLEWGEIGDFELEELSSRPGMDSEQENASKTHQVTKHTDKSIIVTDLEKNLTTRKAFFVISGTIDSIDAAKLKAIEAHLRQIAQEDITLTITHIQEG